MLLKYLLSFFNYGFNIFSMYVLFWTFYQGENYLNEKKENIKKVKPVKTTEESSKRKNGQ